MFIPDPNFFHPGSRIPIQQQQKKEEKNMDWIRYPEPGLDPGIKKSLDRDPDSQHG
jgi:hypothetical protein